VEWWTRAVFLGEPTGSSPNAIGEHTVVPLPYSGLMLSISSRYHQQSYPGDERAWIAPDVPVAMTSADYFAGRDPVLEAARAIIADRDAQSAQPQSTAEMRQ
jgi:hypothetical protein